MASPPKPLAAAPPPTTTTTYTPVFWPSAGGGGGDGGSLFAHQPPTLAQALTEGSGDQQRSLHLLLLDLSRRPAAHLYRDKPKRPRRPRGRPPLTTTATATTATTATPSSATTTTTGGGEGGVGGGAAHLEGNLAFGQAEARSRHQRSPLPPAGDGGGVAGVAARTPVPPPMTGRDDWRAAVPRPGMLAPADGDGDGGGGDDDDERGSGAQPTAAAITTTTTTKHTAGGDANGAGGAPRPSPSNALCWTLECCHEERALPPLETEPPAALAPPAPPLHPAHRSSPHPRPYARRPYPHHPYHHHHHHPPHLPYRHDHHYSPSPLLPIEEQARYGHPPPPYDGRQQQQQLQEPHFEAEIPPLPPQHQRHHAQHQCQQQERAGVLQRYALGGEAFPLAPSFMAYDPSLQPYHPQQPPAMVLLPPSHSNPQQLDMLQGYPERHHYHQHPSAPRVACYPLPSPTFSSLVQDQDEFYATQAPSYMIAPSCPPFFSPHFAEDGPYPRASQHEPFQYCEPGEDASMGMEGKWPFDDHGTVTGPRPWRKRTQRPVDRWSWETGGASYGEANTVMPPHFSSPLPPSADLVGSAAPYRASDPGAEASLPAAGDVGQVAPSSSKRLKHEHHRYGQSNGIAGGEGGAQPPPPLRPDFSALFDSSFCADEF